MAPYLSRAMPATSSKYVQYCDALPTSAYRETDPGHLERQKCRGVGSRVFDVLSLFSDTMKPYTEFCHEFGGMALVKFTMLLAAASKSHKSIVTNNFVGAKFSTREFQLQFRCHLHVCMVNTSTASVSFPFVLPLHVQQT